MSDLSPEPPAEYAGDSIQLDRFLKLALVVQSGGEAKLLIQSGAVLVNGAVEIRRGRKLRPGDTVTVHNQDYVIEASDDANTAADGADERMT